MHAYADYQPPCIHSHTHDECQTGPICTSAVIRMNSTIHVCAHDNYTMSLSCAYARPYDPPYVYIWYDPHVCAFIRCMNVCVHPCAEFHVTYRHHGQYPTAMSLVCAYTQFGEGATVEKHAKRSRPRHQWQEISTCAATPGRRRRFLEVSCSTQGRA